MAPNDSAARLRNWLTRLKQLLPQGIYEVMHEVPLEQTRWHELGEEYRRLGAMDEVAAMIAGSPDESSFELFFHGMGVVAQIITACDEQTIQSLCMSRSVYASESNEPKSKDYIEILIRAVAAKRLSELSPADRAAALWELAEARADLLPYYSEDDNAKSISANQCIFSTLLAAIEAYAAERRFAELLGPVNNFIGRINLFAKGYGVIEPGLLKAGLRWGEIAIVENTMPTPVDGKALASIVSNLMTNCELLMEAEAGNKRYYYEKQLILARRLEKLTQLLRDNITESWPRLRARWARNMLMAHRALASMHIEIAENTGQWQPVDGHLYGILWYGNRYKQMPDPDVSAYDKQTLESVADNLWQHLSASAEGSKSDGWGMHDAPPAIPFVLASQGEHERFYLKSALAQSIKEMIDCDYGSLASRDDWGYHAARACMAEVNTTAKETAVARTLEDCYRELADGLGSLMRTSGLTAHVCWLFAAVGGIASGRLGLSTDIAVRQWLLRGTKHDSSSGDASTVSLYGHILALSTFVETLGDDKELQQSVIPNMREHNAKLIRQVLSELPPSYPGDHMFNAEVGLGRLFQDIPHSCLQEAIAGVWKDASASPIADKLGDATENACERYSRARSQRLKIQIASSNQRRAKQEAQAGTPSSGSPDELPTSEFSFEDNSRLDELNEYDWVGKIIVSSGTRYEIEDIEGEGREKIAYRLRNLENQERIVLVMGRSNRVEKLRYEMSKALESIDEEPDRVVRLADQIIELEPEDDETIFNKGVALMIAQQLEQALACFEESAALEPSKLLYLMHASYVSAMLGRFNDALMTFAHAAAMHPAGIRAYFNKLPKQAEVLRNAAGDLLRQNPEHSEVQRLLEEYLHDAGKEAGEARLYSERAADALAAGALPVAAGCYRDAYVLFKRIGDEKHAALMAHNVAIVEERLGDYHTAASWYEKAGRQFERQGDREKAAAAHLNRGEMAERLGAIVAAEGWYEKARKLFEGIGDERGQATSYRHLGRLAIGRGDLASAEAWYQNAQQALAGLGIDGESAEIHDLLAQIAIRRRHWMDAGRHCIQALELFARVGDTENAQIVQDRLTSIDAFLMPAEREELDELRS